MRTAAQQSRDKLSNQPRTNYPAHGVGMQAWKLLNEGDKACGAVFAVFRQTLYLQCHGFSRPALLCLGPRNLVQGPLNVCTSLPDLSCFETEQPWHCFEKTLTIADVCIDLSAATLWPPRGLSAQTETQWRLPPSTDAIRALKQLVKDGDCVTGIDDSLTGIEKAIHKRLATESAQLQLWLQGDQNTGFPVGLLGCGPGLTPAGDDILVGALIALSVWHTPRFSRLSQQLRALLNTNLPEQPTHKQTHLNKRPYATNDISAAHLLAACDGAAIAPLHNLVDALTPLTSPAAANTSVTAATATEQTGTEQATWHAAKALFEYGHSSGIYAMRGVLLAMQCIADNY